MESLLARFKIANGSDEPDYDAMRARALYPELIGVKYRADDNAPYFMRCECKMLVVTSRELHTKSTVCENCRDNREAELHSSEAPQVRTMSKRGESRILFALVVFCLLAVGVVGLRVMDAPPRAHAESPRLD